MEILKRYRKSLKALTLPNFVTYTTVLFVWMYGGCTQSSSGLEKSQSLKYVKNHKFRPGYHSNELTNYLHGGYMIAQPYAPHD